MKGEEPRERQRRYFISTEEPEACAGAGKGQSRNDSFRNTSAEEGACVPGQGVPGCGSNHYQHKNQNSHEPLNGSGSVGFAPKKLSQVQKQKYRQPLRRMMVQGANPRPRRQHLFDIRYSCVGVISRGNIEECEQQAREELDQQKQKNNSRRGFEPAAPVPGPVVPVLRAVISLAALYAHSPLPHTHPVTIRSRVLFAK